MAVGRDGLRASRERDAPIDNWLREEVVPVMQAALANPDSLVPLDDVFDEIRAIHANQA
jgi:antitoxin ParD1/3/4